MTKTPCTIVGIAGGSGSGKTTISDRVSSAIGKDKIVILSLDSYYKDLSTIEPAARANHNFDHPNVFDIATLVSHLKLLKAAQPIPKIDLDYATLKRKTGKDLIEPKPVVILEGILVLAIPSIRELLDIRVFVEAAPDLRFIRRARREINVYGRTFDEIATQYERFVREMHSQLIEPSKEFADLILPHDQSNERGLEMLIRSLASLVEKQPARAIIWDTDEKEMVFVPTGEFIMGSNDAQIMQLLREYDAQIHWFNDERPAHTVNLRSYYIDKYPITNEQYRKFLKETGGSEPETWNVRRFTHPLQPVAGVTWEDAEAYCVWARKRLPTEAEWEKAARGISPRLFPWGDEHPEGRANYGGRYGGPTPVDKFPEGVSPYNARDMAGNVWEWVSDWYDRDFYSKLDAKDPGGPTSGSGRCVRGGAWINNPTMLRCAERDYRRLPHRDLKYFGFRCVTDVG